METAKIATVEEYFAKLPESARTLMETMRSTIRKAAPNATEVISYGMPAFKQHGVLVYYAAWKEHIGFYPLPSALMEFKKELSAYEGSKGAVQFPFSKPLPVDLITQMVQFRLWEDEEKAKQKKGKKKK